MTTCPADSPETTADDLALAERVWAGDRSAFESLFRREYPGLATYARNLVGAREPAEDIVQDVFVILWTRRDRLRMPENLVGYLYRSVRNRAFNHLRGERHRADWLARHTDPDPETPAVAQQRVEGIDIRQAIRKAAAHLSPRCREVFELSRERNLTYPMIAETLGISIKTVETLMGRALAGIRRQLADHRE